MTVAPARPGIEMGTAAGRGVLFAVVLGTCMSFLDMLIVNVALPVMDSELRLGVVGAQWTVAGYLLVLSSLLLLGGALGDAYGRRRVYLVGVAIFTVASIGCGLAPNGVALVIARLVQGVGGALMMPASLAIIQAVFRPEDRGRAIGAWTGLTSVFTALGPFVGGAFVTYLSWRWGFLINVPIGALTIWATLRWVPENRNDEAAGRRPDAVGAVLASLGLAGVTLWAIQGADPGSGRAPELAGIAGVVLLLAFLANERRTEHPMLPSSLFRSRQFTSVNVCTLIFYGAFVTGVTLLGVRLQVGLGYSPIEAGLATLPSSLLMITLSAKFGALGQRIGARIPMTVGPLIVAVALALMAAVDPGTPYLTFVLPVVVLWGLGLALTVAPLTAAALGAVTARKAGVASAVNNASARLGQSLGIAVLPAVAGMSGGESLGGQSFANGYPTAMVISAALCVVAAAIAAVMVSGRAATVVPA